MDNTDTIVAVFNDHPAAEAAVKSSPGRASR